MNPSPDLSGFRISVAMCTYNGGRYIEEQLLSILCQSLAIHELIISDDGSTDATLDIIQAFIERAPFRVRLMRNQHRLGSSKNFEQTISLCTGDLIALADQDDVWYESKTRTLVQLFAEDPSLGAVFGDAILIDERSSPTGKSLWETYRFSAETRAALSQGKYAGVLLKSPVVTGATMMFRSRLRANILPIPTPWIHDAWMAWMIAMQSKLAFVTEPLMAYRTHSAQQIGVPTTVSDTLHTFDWTRLRNPHNSKKLATVQAYRNQVLELRQLLFAATEVSTRNYDLVHLLLLKKNFCESVLIALNRSRLRRFFFSLRHGRSYLRFSLIGWRAALRDVLL